ncbi:MAG: hypothetical protein E6J47_00500 [Chloroflexi bacterium]|nr:MAG: hypothetical protein E6J47_00500 [Chloroflexota bacterium]
MEWMSAADLRERYQRFFEARGHTRVPAAPLLARDDPTLLFVNSGMVQFKRVLTGEEKRDYTRAVDAQPVLRVAGKHNDFEEVGRTPRHNTLFEMLGNWSFGDYFKREAIAWAWEFLTIELKIDPARLAATIWQIGSCAGGTSPPATTTTSGRWPRPGHADHAARSISTAGRS